MTAVAFRAAADLCGMLALGVLFLRTFAGLPPRDARWVTRLGVAWAGFAALNLLATAAGRSGIALWRVDPAGLAAEVRTVPAAAVTAAAGVLLAGAGRRMPVGIALGVTAIGLAAGPATGHLGLSPVGAAVVTVHVVTAAWWFGGLAAMPLVLRGRAEWSAALAEFSRWALPAVALLGGSGIAAAVIRSPAVDSRYFALLVVKAIAFAALLGVGWWQRRSTTVRARTAPVTRTRRAIALEAGALAAVTTLAAALSYSA
ncbi:CopD family protein [Tsukamurella strandjordii]|uniref:CopD family protein n=1 Tax=Tsukamurella strandjordii TaxID=147577 RepID=A0AA90NGP4_9ACTN|nr:CopD family protein [Tsukamurella strandjordii]MDP0398159.1 CopD family protein [Tsukamurella strandjordii]